MDPTATIRDVLTGAYSRALFDERLPDEVERVRRYGTPLSLLVFDLDHFKAINDAFGHGRGDAVLRETAARCLAGLRSSDALFRFGGDEFCVLLPSTGREQAAVVARRLAQAIASQPFGGEPVLSGSISVGVAVCPDDAQTAEGLFDLADQRSLLAKRQRRGSVVADGQLALSEAPVREASRPLERDEPLARMQRFFELLGGERRGVLRIMGAPGVGRTRFLAETTAAARLRNYRIVELRGGARAKTRPYGVWLEGAPAELPSPEAGVDVLVRALEAQCASLNHGGVFIAADDLGEFDFLSFQLLGQLLTTVGLRRLAVAYTTELRSHRSFASSRTRHHEVVELRPLSREATLVWIRSVIQWEPPASFVDWLYESTDGLPAQLHQVLLRLREQNLLRRVSAREWAIDPSYRAVASSAMARGPVSAQPDHLPSALSEFVGREAEQVSINALLDRARVVSLVGAGGIGKTRLALQIARARTGDFEDGARFVALQSTTDPALVVSVIATALGVRETAGKTLKESLTASLTEKDMLLVLDNFEQVLGAAPLVAELITAAPRLRVLVTTREPLRLAAERVYPVPPLPLPDRGAAQLATDDLTGFAAIALFVLRARAVQYDFALTPENRTAVVELCARLDGLPLALEIAAARVDRMSPAQMLEAQRGFFLGAEGTRDAPARHQTLRNVIDFSYRLLSREQQRLLNRLAAFERGATLDAVVRVCAHGDSSETIEAELRALAEKSLLVEEAGQETRYSLLETVRSFALERLEGCGEGATYRALHAGYFVGAAERLNAALEGPHQRATLERFDREFWNLQAALTFLRASAVGECAKLALHLAPFWERRRNWNEGRAWLEQIAAAPDLAPAARRRCWIWCGRLARFQSDRDATLSRLDLARRSAIADGDEHALAMAVHELGCAVQRLDGNYAEALELLTESLASLRRLGRPAEVAEALTDVGLVLYSQGRFAPAETACREALEIARRIGDARLSGNVMIVLGLTARARGEYADAAAMFEENLGICEHLDDRYGMMAALLNLAELARSRRDFERAAELYQRRIGPCREFGDTAGVARSLQDLGEIARYRGRFEEAEQLYEQCLELFEGCGQVADMVWVRRAQAEAALQRGDRARAKQLFAASLAPHGEHTHSMLIMLDLEGLGAIASLEGRHDRAARIFGAAHPLFEANRSLLAVDDCADYERRFEAARTALGPSEFADRAAEGRALPLAEAIRLACSG